MTIKDCPKCGGTHYGSIKCPYDDNSPNVKDHEISNLRARIEQLEAAVTDLWGVFKRERFDDLCSLHDDDKTVSDIASTALAISSLTKTKE